MLDLEIVLPFLVVHRNFGKFQVPHAYTVVLAFLVYMRIPLFIGSNMSFSDLSCV